MQTGSRIQRATRFDKKVGPGLTSNLGVLSWSRQAAFPVRRPGKDHLGWSRFQDVPSSVASLTMALERAPRSNALVGPNIAALVGVSTTVPLTFPLKWKKSKTKQSQSDRKQLPTHFTRAATFFLPNSKRDFRLDRKYRQDICLMQVYTVRILCCCLIDIHQISHIALESNRHRGLLSTTNSNQLTNWPTNSN